MKRSGLSKSPLQYSTVLDCTALDCTAVVVYDCGMFCAVWATYCSQFSGKWQLWPRATMMARLFWQLVSLSPTSVGIALYTTVYGAPQFRRAFNLAELSMLSSAPSNDAFDCHSGGAANVPLQPPKSSILGEDIKR